MPPVEQPRYAQTLAALRDRIGEAEAFDQARQAGHTLAATAPEKLLDLAWSTLERGITHG
jgi:hypothetical protein